MQADSSQSEVQGSSKGKIYFIWDSILIYKLQVFTQILWMLYLLFWALSGKEVNLHRGFVGASTRKQLPSVPYTVQ